MKPHTDTPGFESSLRFDENRIHAAAIYCSDGRYGEQFDDFLHSGLKLPRYDRLAVPGARHVWRGTSWPAGKKTHCSRNCDSWSGHTDLSGWC